MIIYKTRWFDRWARKEGLNELSLCAAVNEMTAGLYEADLGGGLFKKRIARSRQGKRGGFRTLVATNKGDRWFFVFGFPKNERSNINKKEEEALKKLASVLLSYTLEDLEKAKLEDELMEVICNAEEEISDS
ncbi:MAG: type II toxin-antitoxin system RelE/ParE family toxin [Nostoc sp.]|uniref:type II toxin-antitoxin system RelE/ParE family toxin n=1 Tax=Nostoc sp. TaxID=1180 RepID=UPI002FFB5C28